MQHTNKCMVFSCVYIVFFHAFYLFSQNLDNFMCILIFNVFSHASRCVALQMKIKTENGRWVIRITIFPCFTFVTTYCFRSAPTSQDILLFVIDANIQFHWRGGWVVLILTTTWKEYLILCHIVFQTQGPSTPSLFVSSKSVLCKLAVWYISPIFWFCKPEHLNFNIILKRRLIYNNKIF